MIRKMLSLFLALLLCVSLPAAVFAAGNTEFVYDDAELLTQSEETALRRKLAAVSAEYEAQIVVATIGSLSDSDIDYFVEYLYDSMGFGYGSNHDGVLLLVCMDPREYRILSNGYAGIAINNAAIDNICDEIVSDLSDGDYADAFNGFADECAYYLEGYNNGFPFDAGESLLISLIIGVVVGLIVVLILAAQLKTVRKQNSAKVYEKPGSMRLTVRSDIFLYRNVTRTKRQTSSSSGSGGSARSKGGGSF